MKDHKIIPLVFLVLVIFLSGLLKINLPPQDKHAWRQTLTIGMAKSFVDKPNIFYPRTIIGKDKEVQASEFPFYQYSLSIAYQLFGFQDWYGRLFNWILSLIGIWYIFRFIKKYWNIKIATYALIAFMSSIVLEYSRKTMPDCFSFYLTIIGVVLLDDYIENKKKLNFVFGSIIFLVGVLNKMPFIINGIWLIFPMTKSTNFTKSKIMVLISVTFTLILTYAWYFLWLPYLLIKYDNPLMFPVSLVEGMKIFYSRWEDFIFNLYKNPFHNILLSSIAFVGLYFWYKKYTRSHKIFIVSFFIVFFLYSLKTGDVFPSHDYYVIPIVLILCISFGIIMDQFKLNEYVLMFTAFLISSSGVFYNWRKADNDTTNDYYKDLSSIVDRYIDKKEKILVNGDTFNPILMYWTGHTGWSFNNEDFQKTSWIDDLREKGVRLVIQDKNTLQSKVNYRLLYEDNNWFIYEPYLE